MGGMVVDNFAGGGGASTGIAMAIGRDPDIAINHSPQAIAMHRANHPSTRHLIEDVWRVDPAVECAGRPVDLAWFSPDCTHFSRAKGGKPRSKKTRALAWVVVRWATRSQNCRNRRSNKMVTYRGETKPLTEWIEALGLAPHAAAIQARFRDGWGVDDAFERPLRRVTPWGGKSTRRAA